MSKFKAYVDLARPFTLLPPALGVLSGAATAWGARGSRPPLTLALAEPVLYGTLMAAVLNTASNAKNKAKMTKSRTGDRRRRSARVALASKKMASSFLFSGFRIARAHGRIESNSAVRLCLYPIRPLRL